ncbi:hypothetical protein [Microcoleus sp. herbarium14]|uniref:hypothetical protein n=1 Tax=Microcoleus sp. herbarium14 TaxID=3055439 RepID=UPI002FD79C40
MSFNPTYKLMGDRSFILGDRSSETRKGDRSLCAIGRSSQCLVFDLRGDILPIP